MAGPRAIRRKRRDKKKPAPKGTLRAAANSGETEPMAILKNTRHEKFAQYIAMGMSATEAYAKVGYKQSEAHASRLAGYGKVRARVAELMAPAVEATQATVERVLQELVRLAFYDLTVVFESENGRLTMKDPWNLPEDLRHAIVGIKPVQVGDVLHYECKFADKQRALDSLARYLQMFKDTLVVENVFRVVQEMTDDELDRRLAELERAYSAATTLDSAAKKRLH